MGLIHGRHVYEATETLQSEGSKSAKIILSVVRAARQNAMKKGLVDDRLFIKTALVGKGRGHHKIDIKARGKHGVITVPKSSVSITLEQMSDKEMYKKVLKGETPRGLAKVQRRILYSHEA